MNNQFNAKILLTLANQKANQGFTLIELLVAFMIVGVLAAIALPNYLSQVGKARETEAKGTIGAMTRAQQIYFSEEADFATSVEQLAVPIGNEKYYVISVPLKGVQLANGSTDPKNGLVDPSNANGKNGTRDYISGIAYDTLSRTFDSVVCRADNSLDKYVLAVVHAPTGSGAITEDATTSCQTSTTEVIE